MPTTAIHDTLLEWMIWLELSGDCMGLYYFYT